MRALVLERPGPASAAPLIARDRPQPEPAAGELRLESVDLEEALAANPDCVVIVTPHPEVDWDAVFRRADLVVDTRDVSAGRRVGPGQVLRLGAGWS